MKIRLENFLCYSEASFDFGEEGVALLSGMSGSGKTSIFKAIFFALFGEGNKLVTYGKTSCTVELEFDDIKILRTKRPNRLVVNDTHEDAAAQDIINKKFGDTFKTSGYIQQNNISSFILMSPIEKLAFLEKFAFRDIDLAKVKGRCKAHISKCHDELISVSSQLEMAKEVLSSMEAPTTVIFPLKCKKSQREKAITNENIRYKNCGILCRRYRNVIIRNENEITSLKVLEATLETREENKKDLYEKLEKNQNSLNSCIYEGDNQLDDYEERLKQMMKTRKLYLLEDQFKENSLKLTKMKEDEVKELNTKIENINKKLWKDYSSVEVNETISDLQEYLGDLELLEALTKDLQLCNVNYETYEKHKMELKESLKKLEENQQIYNKLLVQKEIYSCPCCTAKLKIANKELIVAQDFIEDTSEQDIEDIEDIISKIKITISKLQRIIPMEEDKLERKIKIDKEIHEITEKYEEISEINSIKEDIKYMKNYRASQIELEKKLQEIEKLVEDEIFSSSYNTFKSGVSKLRRQLTEIKKNITKKQEILSEEELRCKVLEQTQIKNKIHELTQIGQGISMELDNCKSVITNAKKKHIDKYKTIKSIKELENDVLQKRKSIKEQEENKRIHQKNLNEIDNWQKYKETHDKYQEWVNKTKKLTVQEKEAKNEYAASTELKHKILEAESIAMINIIDSINMHARVYLDSFFSENPISVQLQTFKHTKTNVKPSINLSIEYKGMEADMNMLSGGELSRVILAYTLALAEMFNTPLLLLDECTASLDQELTGVVFDSIRDNFGGKMTLIIAHQIIKGQFDKVITLNDSTIIENI